MGSYNARMLNLRPNQIEHLRTEASKDQEPLFVSFSAQKFLPESLDLSTGTYMTNIQAMSASF